MKTCFVTECMVRGAKERAFGEGRADIVNIFDRRLCQPCPLGFQDVAQTVINMKATIADITESYQRLEERGYHPGSKDGK